MDTTASQTDPAGAAAAKLSARTETSAPGATTFSIRAWPAGLVVVPTATATVNLTSLVPVLVKFPEKDHEPVASGSQMMSVSASVARAEGVGTPVAGGGLLEDGVLTASVGLLEAVGLSEAGG